MAADLDQLPELRGGGAQPLPWNRDGSTEATLRARDDELQPIVEGDRVDQRRSGIDLSGLDTALERRVHALVVEVVAKLLGLLAFEGALGEGEVVVTLGARRRTAGRALEQEVDVARGGCPGAAWRRGSGRGRSCVRAAGRSSSASSRACAYAARAASGSPLSRWSSAEASHPR